MTTLEQAKEVLAWMRREGLRHVCLGDLELELAEPEPESDMDEDAPEWERPNKPLEIEDDPELYGGDPVPMLDPVRDEDPEPK